MVLFNRPSSPHPGFKRLLAATLVPVMGAGCLVLWIGIPLAWLRIGSWLSDTGHVVFVVALVACPITMVLWGWALYRLNDVHFQLTGQERPLLESMLVVSVLLAVPAMAIWFFVLAPASNFRPVRFRHQNGLARRLAGAASGTGSRPSGELRKT